MGVKTGCTGSIACTWYSTYVDTATIPMRVRPVRECVCERVYVCVWLAQKTATVTHIDRDRRGGEQPTHSAATCACSKAQCVHADQAQALSWYQPTKEPLNTHLRPPFLELSCHYLSVLRCVSVLQTGKLAPTQLRTAPLSYVSCKTQHTQAVDGTKTRFPLAQCMVALSSSSQCKLCNASLGTSCRTPWLLRRKWHQATTH